jgi:Sulfotransferase family
LNDPVVVIGMGRSGTKLLTDALERLGVFMGVSQDMNDEALLFLKINRELMRSVGASWYAPELIASVLEDPVQREQLAAWVAPRLRGPQALSYLGLPRLLRFRSLGAQAGLWGWKDPRSTWTLPLWRELFPDLRVVHLLRHGVDVAASLRRIGQRLGTDADARRDGPRLAVFQWRGRRVLRPMIRGGWIAEAARFDSLEPALDLWSRYVDHARAQVRELGPRAIELRFEDLASDPAPAISALGRLLGTEPTSEQLEATSRLIDRGRSAAYERDPELRDFAQANAELLARYGY